MPEHLRSAAIWASIFLSCLVLKISSTIPAIKGIPYKNQVAKSTQIRRVLKYHGVLKLYPCGSDGVFILISSFLLFY